MTVNEAMIDWMGRNSQNKVIVFPKENYDLKKGDYVCVKVNDCTQATLLGEDNLKAIMNSIIENNKQQIMELCKKHHVKKLYVFGSVMREDFSRESDIDFLYEFDTSKINFDDLDNAEYDYVNNFFLSRKV